MRTQHTQVLLTSRSLLWVLLFGVLAGHWGQAHADPRLALGTLRSFPGQTVEVPLRFNYATNDSRTVVAFQADIRYDSRGIDSGGLVRGNAAPTHAVLSRKLTNGLRRILVYSLNNRLITNGLVGGLPFTIEGGQFRNFPLTLANVIVADAEAQKVNARTTSGGLAVAPVFVRPDGVADFFLSVEPERSYAVQASTNFVDWVDLNVVSTTDSLLVQLDIDSALYPHRFYRASPRVSSTDPKSGPLLAEVSWMGAELVIRVTGSTNASYVIQESINLIDWSDLPVLPQQGASSLSITSAVAPGNTRRFYRGLER